MSRLFIPHLRKRGILTFYWILNEREDWEKAISMGCRGIMTDEPSKLFAFLKEKQLYF
jgi:glycerophosphoryl diester phosphodiesterase